MNGLKVRWPLSVYFNDEAQAFWINAGHGTMFRLIAARMYSRHAFFVGIEARSCFLFDVKCGKHWNYVGEKLAIPDSNAGIIADWINVQTNIEYEQQGLYLPSDFTGGVETYKSEIILNPEILNDA